MTDTADQPTLQLVDAPPPVPKLKRASAAERARIAGHPSAFTVPFGQIRLADNIRADATDVSDLADTIRRYGLQTPIAVRSYGVDSNDRTVFVVETGHRRYNALRALGLTADDPVPVHLVTAAPGPERTVRQFVENAQRKHLTAIDEANTLATLTDRYEMNVRDAAKLLRIDRNTAARRLLLLRLPEPAQRAVADGEWEIEAAQLVGRLIRDDAPTVLTDRLAADRCTRTRAQAAVDEHNAKRSHDRIRAQLESRGYVVVSDPKNGPAPDGHRTEMYRHVGTADLDVIKRLDVGDIDTVRDDNGRPVVWLSRSATGDMNLYSLNLRKLAEPAPTAADDGDGPLSYRQREHAKQLLKAERTRTVVEWVAGPNKLNDRTLYRLALRQMLSRAHTIDVRAVAAAVGTEPVMLSDTHINLEATADRWFEQLDHEQTRQALVLVSLLHAALLLGYSDGEDEPELSPAVSTLLTTVTTGMRAPLPVTEFDQYARAVLDDPQ